MMKYKIVDVTLVTAGKLASADNFSGGPGGIMNYRVFVVTLVTAGKLASGAKFLLK